MHVWIHRFTCSIPQREPDQNHPRLIPSSWSVHILQRPFGEAFPQHLRCNSFYTAPSYEILVCIQWHHYHLWRSMASTRMLYCKFTVGRADPHRQPYWTTIQSQPYLKWWRSGSKDRLRFANQTSGRNQDIGAVTRESSQTWRKLELQQPRFGWRNAKG